MKRPDGCTPQSAMVFERRDPQMYVLLYARVAADGALPQTRFIKPLGTEYAGPSELADMGYVPNVWKLVAAMLGEHLDEEQMAGFSRLLHMEVGQQVAEPLLRELANGIIERSWPKEDEPSAEERGVAVVPAVREEP